jgi:RNA polymerase sigma factor (sigma-70 family)
VVIMSDERPPNPGPPPEPSRPSDLDLLRAWYENGDHEAFQTLFDAYRPLLAGVVARRFARNSALLADTDAVVQDVFIRLMTNAKSLIASRLSLKSWLCTVADRLAIDHYRRYVNRRKAEDGGTSGKDTTDGPGAGGDSGELGALKDCWDKLPAHLLTYVNRKYLDQEQNNEIAVAMGVSQATVSRRLWDAENWLRACVEKRMSGIN